MADAANQPSEDDILYFADRPTPEYDEVVLQADYAARATLSFFRFRELGGERNSEIIRPHGEELAAAEARKQENGAPTRPRLKKGGIHYVSDHPQVRMLNLSIIALLILFESCANAYFFAQQSEFGLSGGLFQAAAVSLANVATSYFIIGFWGLRHVSMPSTEDRFAFNRRNLIRGFGALAIIIGLIMVLLVNLSAAHYRNILDLRAAGLTPPTDIITTFPRFWISEDVCRSILGSEIGQSIGSAATSAMCRPFALHSLDAMILFALGITISALAAFEGRRADSAFPGFSDAARQLERARRDLQFALEDYYESFEDVVADAEERLTITLTPKQRAAFQQKMDKKVEKYQKLLTTQQSILANEFKIDPDLVAKIARTSPDDQERGA